MTDDPGSEKNRLFSLSVFRKHWNEFSTNPFDYLDSHSLRIGKLDINIFRDDVDLRRFAFKIAMVFSLIWIVCGWDSTLGQIMRIVYMIPDLIVGTVTVQNLVNAYQIQYGMVFHHSAVVIYLLMFWGLSKYYKESYGLTGSRNLTLSFAFTMFSVGIFETFWHFSYAVGQNQWWIISFRMPQLRVQGQFLFFIAVGIFTLLALRMTRSKIIYIPKIPRITKHIIMWEITPNTYGLPKATLKFDKWTIIILITMIATIRLWWLYPGPIEYINVPVLTGKDTYENWTNTRYFPQTVYTVDTNLTDELYAGMQTWVQNDVLHGVNTICKISVTLFIFAVCRLEKKKEWTE